MNNDTPTIAEAFNQATSSLTSDNSEEVEVNAEEVDETEEDSEVEQTEEAETDESTEEESDDFENVDPKTLPKELQPLYKNLMKGFTQGRQRDSEKAKEAEERAQKLEERLAKLEAGAKPSESQEEAPKFNTPEEYYKWVAQQEAKQTVERERVDSFRKQAVSDFEEFDPRFKEGEQFDPIMRSAIGAQLDEMLGDYVEQHGTELGFPYRSHLKSLVDSYDKHVQQQVQSFIKKQNEINKKQAERTKKVNPKTSNAKSKPEKVSSIREAIGLALDKSR